VNFSVIWGINQIKSETEAGDQLSFYYGTQPWNDVEHDSLTLSLMDKKTFPKTDKRWAGFFHHKFEHIAFVRVQNRVIFRAPNSDIWMTDTMENLPQTLSSLVEILDALRSYESIPAPTVKGHLYYTHYNRPLPEDRMIRWDYYNHAGTFETRLGVLGTEQEIAARLQKTYAGQHGAFFQRIPLPGFERHPAFRASLKKMHYPVIVWQVSLSKSKHTPYIVTRFHPDDEGNYTIQASPEGGLPDYLKKVS
jgi:hypothetical protein